MQLKYLVTVGRVACMVGFTFMADSAQVSSQSDSILLVMPVAGHAIRARQVEEHILLTSGKPFVTQIGEKIIYRDLVGRMRIEPISKAEKEESHTGTTTLIDPIQGTLTILDPSSKMAMRVVGAVLPGQSGFLLPRFDTVTPTADWKTVTDSMEPRHVAGFMFTGTRITHVSPGLKPSTIIYEWWVSSKSGLIAEASAIGYEETRRYRIAQFQWDAKITADLFTVPSDYTTQDLTFPQPGKE